MPSRPSKEHSSLTGRTLLLVLARFDVTVSQFCRHTGWSRSAVYRWAAQDSLVPRSIAFVLMSYSELPWTRRVRGCLPVHLKAWGVRPGHENGPREAPRAAVSLPSKTEG